MSLRSLIRRIAGHWKKRRASRSNRVKARPVQEQNRPRQQAAPSGPAQEQPADWREKINLERKAARESYRRDQGRVLPEEEKKRRRARQRGREGPER